jgi:NADPH:quinone reductase-like Zn-dependent oxidoreductase
MTSRLHYFRSCLSKPIPKYEKLSTSTSRQIGHQKTARFHTSSRLDMKAVCVISWGSPPEYISVPDLPAPSPTQLQLKVVAVGVSRVVRGRAAGKHPSAFNASLPFDPSTDGVGLDEATGDLYFVNNFDTSLFTERANVERKSLVKLDNGVDPVTVAANANPAASSWMALKCRAVGGCEGRTVVIVGATSASGRAAAFIARSLGAARVVGISRSEQTLATVQGLDERIVMSKDESPETFSLPSNLGPVHIVIDYVGGPASIGLMKSAQIPEGENLQYIYVGGLSGHENIDLPIRLINVKPIRIMASGLGSWSRQDLKREANGLVASVTKMDKLSDVVTAPFADVKAAWDSEETKTKRLVLFP